MIGSTVAHYRVLRRFGADSQDAFVAEDLENGGDVVIKVLPSAVPSTTGFAGVEKVARALSEMVSPGKAALVETVQAADRSFLVLDPEHAAELLTELRELGQQLTAPILGRGSGPDAMADAGSASEATTFAVGLAAGTSGSELASGRLLGARYRLIKQLGRGGMGVVWHAFDLKLQVEVALKALRRDRFPDEASFELLRHEVRAGREVISPNVCRIYDLVEQEQQEFLSMEYVDGMTLIDFLRDRGPLETRDAGPIVSQFLAGLEAIHAADLVHRDIKPENVMVTRTGRVVVMDFGIAQALSAGPKDEVAGTLPYMAPELLCGDAPDARSDVYAAGVVLAEMVAPDGVRDYAARERVWQAARETPPEVAEGAWKSILERALAVEPDERFATIHEFAHALESVTPRVVGADDTNPYPGLQSFSTTDAQYFYGREVEVEALWKRIQRSQLLAVIGASGSGKSSFLQAGVIPTRPDGWGFVLCHPGTNPFLSLARALAPQIEQDATMVDALLRFEDPDVAVSMIDVWRRKYDDAVVIVDQFEECFTQCSKDTRARFVWLLRRLALDADVRVLLSMRDDFLIHCQDHPLLAPIFAELTALGTLTGNALRRALVQPALACGYRFESEELVDEILDDVRGERGALPLLAFAMSRLWEKRERDTGRLTRAAYEELGRVGGALAQHAEAALKQIGAGRQGILREIFRNLVTSQGTRAAVTTADLRSVFGGAKDPNALAAQEVLRTLIDARLLTSYEETLVGDGGPRAQQRVEVVHESLFQSWPRLVRWRTQDAAGAQLRDQLRQAAKVWSDRGRTDDLLWSGKTLREYLVWREDYPGGLTATEQAFAAAMVRKAERQRRRNRRLLVGSFIVLVAVVGVISASLVRSMRESRRARANELFRQGERLPEHRATTRLAHAIAALELRDDPQVRRFALKTLWQGPAARVTPERGGFSVDFTRDGAELVSSPFGRPMQIWNASGGAPKLIEDSLLTAGEGYHQFAADRSKSVGYQLLGDKVLRLWSYPEWEEVAALQFDGFTLADLSPNREFMVTRTDVEDEAGLETTLLQVWALVEAPPTLLGARVVPRIPEGGGWHSSDFTAIDNAGSRVLYAVGRRLEMLSVADFDKAVPIRVGEHDTEIRAVSFHPDGDRILTVDKAGEIRLWSAAEMTGEPLRSFLGQADIRVGFQFDPSGNLFGAPSVSGMVEVWDLSAPAQQRPVRLSGGPSHMFGIAFHPSGKWIATSTNRQGLSLWSVERKLPLVIRTDSPVADIAVSPDGSLIASVGDEGVRLWSTGAGEPVDGKFLSNRATSKVQWDPHGDFVAVRGHGWSGVGVISLVDGSIQEFGSAPSTTEIWNNFEALGVSPSGRYIAVEWVALGKGEDARIHVHDRDTGHERVLLTGQYAGVGPLIFISDTQLLHDIRCEEYLWDLEADTHVKQDFSGGLVELSHDRKSVFQECNGVIRVYDRTTRQSREIRTLQENPSRVAFAQDGAFYAVGMPSGDVLMGRMDGSEPHLLLGHDDAINRVRVDPQGRWLASAGNDGTIRIWPIPQGRPLHTLPRREFIAKLRSFTNLRVVSDDESESGWRLERLPFQGWRQHPDW